MTPDIIDCHTHHADATAALIAVDPRQFDPQPGLWYSVGYHPWHDVDKLTEADFKLLELHARHPQVLAIGETGLDSLRGADLETQASVFVRHLQVAHATCKPVVVHCVRTAQRIIDERRKAGLTAVPLAIHGMRANERIARTLLDAGCYLSFGIRFNPATLLATPPDRMLIETDEAPATISEVASAIGDVLGMPYYQVIKTAAENTQRLLNGRN
jgi:TatD DNase family protein